MNLNNWNTLLLGLAGLAYGAYLYIWDKAYNSGTFLIILGLELGVLADH